jgi:hypothetical protein
MARHDEAPSSSRRELIRNIAITATLGPLSAEAAQHVHHEVSEAKKTATGAYKPRLFTAHEFETFATLADLIIPGARKAGAAEFVDLLASNYEPYAAEATGGLAWLDREMERRHGSPFIKCARAQQTALLDLIAYRETREKYPDLGPGIVFFAAARNMAADAYFTSREGIAELGYKGNKGMKDFQVPKEALEYALKRSRL